VRLCLIFVWQTGIDMDALGLRFSVWSAGIGILLNTCGPQNVRKFEYNSARVTTFRGQGLTRRKEIGYSEMKVSC
jgi:hypothetical protein